MVSIMRVRAPSKGWLGGPGLNTFYFRMQDPELEPTDGACQLAHDRVRAAFQAGHDLYPIAWKMTVDPTVDTIDPANGELTGSFSASPSAEVVGTGGAGFNAIASGLLLRLNTAGIVEGRRVKGRAFLSPIGPREESDGSPNEGGRGVALSIGTALMDEGITGPPLAVWSRPVEADAEHVPPIEGRDGSVHLVTSVTVPDIFVVLRSRRD